MCARACVCFSVTVANGIFVVSLTLTDRIFGKFHDCLLILSYLTVNHSKDVDGIVDFKAVFSIACVLCNYCFFTHLCDVLYCCVHSSPSSDLSGRRGVFSRRHFGSVELVSCHSVVS